MGHKGHLLLSQEHVLRVESKVEHLGLEPKFRRALTSQVVVKEAVPQCQPFTLLMISYTCDTGDPKGEKSRTYKLMSYTIGQTLQVLRTIHREGDIISPSLG